MKLFIFLAAIGFVAAAPKVQKLGFKNLYVTPKTPITERPSPRIYGGHEAEPNSIPYQAFLTVYSPGGGWYCGGSLISETRVLTAGHCGDGADTAEIVLGAHRPLQSEDTQVTVISSSIAVHPDYNIGFDIIANDVAVAKLDEAVSLTNAIQTVTLASDPSESYVGATATVSGWGLTDGVEETLSDVLNTLNSTVISNDECVLVFDFVQDSNICITADQNTGTSIGDSGGPLTVGGVQVGIVSFGSIFPGYPSGFARVTSFLDFINTNL